MRITSEKTLERFRTALRCDICYRYTATEPHHCFARGRGDAFRNDLSINLLALCRDCHTKAEGGQISREKCLTVIARREGLELDTLKTILQRLRHANG